MIASRSRTFWLLAAAWTVLSALAMVWDVHNLKQRVLVLAETEARVRLERDIDPATWVDTHKRASLPLQAGAAARVRFISNLVRNPANPPDEWETAAFDRLDVTPDGVSECVSINGHQYLRRLQALPALAPCQSCHGARNAGSAGRPLLVRAAASVAVPVDPYEATIGGQIKVDALTRVAIWLVGLGVIGYGSRRERKFSLAAARDHLLLRKLHHAVDQSASGLVITDAAGSIEYANPRFCAISGYGVDELIGRNPRLLRSTDTNPSVYVDMWSTLAAGRDWRGELRNRRKDGSVYWCLQTISPIRDELGATTHYVGVAEDISERKHAEETIHHLAFYDALTDLPNRRLLRDRLEQALAWGRRTNAGVALLYIDLDRFKTINDTLGHAVGDTLLVTMARRLSAVLRENDTLARLGGDEFAVVLGSIHGREEVALVAQKLVTAAQRAVQVDGHELHVTASIGIALYPDDATDAETLIKAADAAMYRTKGEGKNGYRFYANDLGEFSIDRLEIENGLRQAAARGELTLDYQPKQDLASGRIYGVEALVRWNHPRLGRLEPMRFIPVAEELGLISEIGGWVINEACRRAAAWHAAGHRLNVAVNLSPLQLHQSDLLSVVDAALVNSGLPPAALELEITESALIGHREQAEDVVRALRDRGVSIAIDDFGAGYSSLSYLRHFPVAVLKVDQSFIQALGHSPADDALVRAIIVLASGLGLTVVAEGVETEAQRDTLQAMGCHLIQGAWLAHPLAPDELSARLAGWAT